ncbi:MAG: hypothetical protein EBR82_30090 [Caulobacteraceae bacterium]|nr:hypothetical protein [Caulobacteraceae bacterium]
MNKIDEIASRVCRRLVVESGLDLGNVQFSPRRTDGAPTDEPDTDDEHDLYASIKNWVDYGVPNRHLANQLYDLLKDPKYRSFFRPPRSVPIYRGLVDVPQSTVDRWLKGPENASAVKEMAESYAGEEKCDFVMDEGNPIESWSYSKDIAREFARERRPSSRCYNIVLTALPSSDLDYLVDLASIQHRVRGLMSAGDEKEVLALGPVRITQIWWSTPPG